MANLSKRALYVIGACIAVVAVGLGVLALVSNAKDSADRAEADERYADRLLQWKESQYGQRDRVKDAETKLRGAAEKWHRAWRSGEAKRVEARADDIAKMNAPDRSRINQGLPKPTPTPLLPSAGGAGIFSDLPDAQPEAKKGVEFDPEAYIKGEKQRQPTTPIRRALPVSPTPTAAKSPAILHNHE